MRSQSLTQFSELKINQPIHALVENVDLVITRFGEAESDLSGFYGRCAHRGALLADG
jgi:hypothetical protein